MVSWGHVTNMCVRALGRIGYLKRINHSASASLPKFNQDLRPVRWDIFYSLSDKTKQYGKQITTRSFQTGRVPLVYQKWDGNCLDGIKPISFIHPMHIPTILDQLPWWVVLCLVQKHSIPLISKWWLPPTSIRCDHRRTRKTMGKIANAEQKDWSIRKHSCLSKLGNELSVLFKSVHVNIVILHKMFC